MEPVARLAPGEGVQSVGGEVLELRQADRVGSTLADLDGAGDQ